MSPSSPGPAAGAATGSTGQRLWTYNFGPHRFTQLVTLRDGTVVKVESGVNGYSP
jgi:hypothetical protein